MKRRVLVSESEMVDIIKRITEEINLEDYDTYDFIDVFFQVFRSWLYEKIGDNMKRYPMTLLLRKYGRDFVSEKNLFDEEEDGSWDEFKLFTWNVSDFGRRLVEKLHYELPSSLPTQKFTETFKKIIPRMIEELKLPSFVKVVITEEKINRVDFFIVIDFEQWMKYPKELEIDIYKIKADFIDLMEKFLGVEEGNPAHGQVQINVHEMLEKLDDFTKNEFNKVIKKLFKNMTFGNFIRSSKLITNRNGGWVEFKYNSNTSWGAKKGIRENAKKVLSELGYGPNLQIYN